MPWPGSEYSALALPSVDSSGCARAWCLGRAAAISGSRSSACRLPPGSSSSPIGTATLRLGHSPRAFRDGVCPCASGPSMRLRGYPSPQSGSGMESPSGHIRQKIIHEVLVHSLCFIRKHVEGGLIARPVTPWKCRRIHINDCAISPHQRRIASEQFHHPIFDEGPQFLGIVLLAGPREKHHTRVEYGQHVDRLDVG